MALKDLMKSKINGELPEGAHPAVLTSVEYVEGTSADYLKCTFTISPSNKQYQRNMFENDVRIGLSQLRRQLNRANEDITPEDFINELINSKTSFFIYISYPIVKSRNGSRRVQNLNFLPPIENTESTDLETAIDEMAALPA